MAQGDVESSASSCYRLCNGEAIGSPYSFQLYVYTSTRLDMVVMAMLSEGPDSCALIGALLHDATLWGSVSEQHQK